MTLFEYELGEKKPNFEIIWKIIDNIFKKWRFYIDTNSKVEEKKMKIWGRWTNECNNSEKKSSFKMARKLIDGKF
jgi:hypothetical protein